jgi:hypothetical protein
LEGIEDYYTYYVQILEVHEDIFWFADISFVMGIVANKNAYDGWLDYELEKARERNS